MKLTIPDRIVLVTILPPEGDYLTLKLIRKLRESLSFNEEEHKQLNFKYKYECRECKVEVYSAIPVKCENEDCERFGHYMKQTNLLNWDESVNLVKDVHMGRKAKELIRSILKKYSDEKKLNEQYLDVYEKFVKAVEEEDE